MTDLMEYPLGATPLEADELEGLKFSHVTTRQELDHLEQANVEESLRWLRRRKKGRVLDDRFVREVHKRLFGEVWLWAGSYRRSEKNIGVDPIQIEPQLHNLLNDVAYWADHKTYAPIEAAIRFHHRMVYIHPFANGNGRHARIMADLLLDEVFGHEPIDWSGGHDLQTMSARREAYIQALRTADTGDYAPLFEFAGVTDEN